MGHQAALSDMVACRVLMYNPMGWIPAASIASPTIVYYHYPPDPRFSAIPMIRRTARWWKPSRALSIYPVITQLSLPYKSTD